MWRTRRGFITAADLYGRPRKRVRLSLRRWSWVHLHRHLKADHRPRQR